MHKFIKLLLAVLLIFFVTVPFGADAQTRKRSLEELERLVAPVALYQDDLLSQVLTASTVLDEVILANQYLKDHGGKVDSMPEEDWDPSVKALLYTPDAIYKLNENLNWTRELGSAVEYQLDDLMTAVQNVRNRAVESGSLKTSEQQKVSVEDNSVKIESQKENTVYVPTYSSDSFFSSTLAPTIIVLAAGFLVSDWWYNSYIDWPGRCLMVRPSVMGYYAYPSSGYYYNRYSLWNAPYYPSYYDYGYNNYNHYSYNSYNNYNNYNYNNNACVWKPHNRFKPHHNYNGNYYTENDNRYRPSVGNHNSSNYIQDYINNYSNRPDRNKPNTSGRPNRFNDSPQPGVSPSPSQPASGYQFQRDRNRTNGTTGTNRMDRTRVNTGDVQNQPSVDERSGNGYQFQRDRNRTDGPTGTNRMDRTRTNTGNEKDSPSVEERSRNTHQFTRNRNRDVSPSERSTNTRLQERNRTDSLRRENVYQYRNTNNTNRTYNPAASGSIRFGSEKNSVRNNSNILSPTSTNQHQFVRNESRQSYSPSGRDVNTGFSKPEATRQRSSFQNGSGFTPRTQMSAPSRPNVRENRTESRRESSVTSTPSVRSSQPSYSAPARQSSRPSANGGSSRGRWDR